MPAIKLNLILFVSGFATIPYGVFAGACPEMQAPPGAAISFTSQIMEGTTITATCTNGGMMNGPSMLTCIGGQWRPEAFGTCTGSSGWPGSSTGTRGAQCLPMLAPPGSTLTYGSGSPNSGLVGLQNHGTTVTMACNDNTSVTGASNSVCQNGIWIPPVLGTCITSGSSGILPNSIMFTPFASADIMCHLGLIAPLNGDVTYSASLPAPSGSTATLTCRPGYSVRGASVSTCQNGIFGMLGTCEKSK